MKNNNIQCTFEKLVYGGQALGKYNKKVLFAWNALPGELVDVSITKKKKSYSEGVATTIHSRSPHRIAPQESHYLSCSPWQILSWEEENRWKKEIAKEVFTHAGFFKPNDTIDIVYNGAAQYGYRNKIEYSFSVNNSNQLSFAFFERGTHRRAPIIQCNLATDTINTAAHPILSWLNEYRFPLRSLKSLIVRSNDHNEAIMALFIKDKISLLKEPPLSEPTKGISFFYSDPRCPASRPDELLKIIGDTHLSSTIHGFKLKYGIHSFFQVNLPLFNTVIDDIRPFLNPQSALIDFYSGVGAISIPLSSCCKTCTLIENNKEAIAFANENISINNLSHFKTLCVSTEKAIDEITKESIVLFDPPRSGLHQKLIKQLLAIKPKKIIYLSCNISTQARDISMLINAYTVPFKRLYNFFPRTPHIESLCVLESK